MDDVTSSWMALGFQLGHLGNDIEAGTHLHRVEVVMTDDQGSWELV